MPSSSLSLAMMSVLASRSLPRPGITLQDLLHGLHFEAVLGRETRDREAPRQKLPADFFLGVDGWRWILLLIHGIGSLTCRFWRIISFVSPSRLITGKRGFQDGD